MKRIYCSLLVVMFVLLSPFSAFASTTESMLMYAASEDDYSVMPLSVLSSYDITFYNGVYNRANESFDMSNYTFTDVSNGVPLLPNTDWQDLIFHHFTYNTNLMAAFGFSLGTPGSSSPISIPDGSTLSLEVDDLFFNGWDDFNQRSIKLLNTNAFPYRVYADMYFTATQQIGNTHSPTYHSQTVELSQFMNAKPGQDPNLFDINCRIPIKADTSTVSTDIDRLYNINLRYIKVYAVYPFYNNYSYHNYDKFSFVDGNKYALAITFRDNSIASTRVYFNYSQGNAGDIIDSSTNAIQSSISTFSNNINNQLGQVKTQLTQSTNTITSKIDTMSQDIQTGLQNVVTSAQQNTQNIINTVTTKVDEVKTSVGEVKDAVVDLPNKLEEKAIGLVVPEEEVIADKFDDFTGTLEQELGILYEVPQMVYDLGDTITSNIAEPQKQMTFPALSLSMPDGQDYQIWGDIVFDIMPAGMEILQDFCMTITGLIMVTATVNAVKEQYELFIRDQKGR